MNTGIYAIEHAASGRRYVGSAVNFGARWRVHRHHLERGTHHSKHLQSAWNKYGGDAFVFKKLLICAKDHLLMYEQLCIDGYKSFDRLRGYNARPLAASNLGMKMSPEAVAKGSANRSKPFFSAECRARMSAMRKGKKMPEWFGEFVRKMKTGTKHTPEAKAKISASSAARKATPETIAKMRATHLAIWAARRAAAPEGQS